jgi:hypothetical protein
MATAPAVDPTPEPAQAPVCARCRVPGLNTSYCSLECQEADEQARLDVYPHLVEALQRIRDLTPKSEQGQLYADAHALGTAQGIAMSALARAGRLR